MFDLEGKRAVVTGGARGIGQAIVLELAAAGADVASFHLAEDEQSAENTAEGIVRAGRRSLMRCGDVRDSQQVRSFADDVRATFGGIDIWVNNAARLQVTPFLEMERSDWQAILDCNLNGYVNGCTVALEAMLDQGDGGRIINVSSVTLRQPVSGLSAYIASKGAITALTKALALEFAPHGILINAIAPGAIETPLTKDSYTGGVRRAYENRISVGRVGMPKDIAGAVVFLASDGAAYICGHEFLIDGGLSLNGSVGFVADTERSSA